MPSTAHSTRKLKRPYKPTDESRKMVKAMTAYGINQNEICSFLNITVPTLHKHFRHEIDIAQLEANAAVAQALFTNATKNNNVVAQIFWLKTRNRWIEPRPEREEGETSVTIKVTGGLPEEHK